MKKEEFSELLGDINDNYIKEAHMKKSTSKNLWVKIGVAAACFGLVAAAIIALPNITAKNDITDSGEITTDISVSTGDEVVASSSCGGDYPAFIIILMKTLLKAKSTKKILSDTLFPIQTRCLLKTEKLISSVIQAHHTLNTKMVLRCFLKANGVCLKLRTN